MQFVGWLVRAGPASLDAATVRAWLVRMRQMRTACQQSIAFNKSVYELPGLEWVQTAYLSPQMHVFDRTTLGMALFVSHRHAWREHDHIHLQCVSPTPDMCHINTIGQYDAAQTIEE